MTHDTPPRLYSKADHETLSMPGLTARIPDTMDDSAAIDTPILLTIQYPSQSIGSLPYKDQAALPYRAGLVCHEETLQAYR